MAGKDAVISGDPIGGKGDRYFFHEYFEKEGLRRSDVLIANVIRCCSNTGQFPTGALKKQAIVGCAKRWDGDLLNWKPDIMLVTFSPLDTFKSPALGKFIRTAVRHAIEFSKQGYRPALLMGNEPREKYAPWLTGAGKKWQRTWWKV